MKTAMTKRTQTIALLSGLLVAVGLVGLAGQADAQRRRGYTYQTGQELYEHICQGCHMPDGKGAVGAAAYPALAGNRKLNAPLYPALVLLRGQKSMPAFSDLSDEQIAAVTNYIRTSHGNAFPGQVTPEQVKGLRPRAVRQDAQRPGE